MPRRVLALPAPPESGKRIVSILLAAILGIALFALFRPGPGVEPSPATAAEFASPAR